MSPNRATPVVVMVSLFAALVLVTATPAGAQCAMCQSSLLNSPEGQEMAQGFNTAILFLLGAPYLVFGTLAGSILWTRRRRRNEARWTYSHPGAARNGKERSGSFSKASSR